MNRRTVTTIGWMFAATVTVAQQAPDSILQTIMQNNLKAQAIQKILEANTFDIKSQNNLANPTVEYAHLWGDSNDNSKEEVAVVQSFAFPITRNAQHMAGNAQISFAEAEAEVELAQIAFDARMLLIKQATANHLLVLYNSRIAIQDTLKALLEKRFAAGFDAAYELNKVTLEKTIQEAGKASLLITIAEQELNLSQMNGGKEVAYSDTAMPSIVLPANENDWIHMVQNSSRVIKLAGLGSEVAIKDLSLQKAKGLPELEIGYRRAVEDKVSFNGFQAGISIPLWQNHGKVSAAKARVAAANLEQQDQTGKVRMQAMQLWKKREQLERSVSTLKVSLTQNNNTRILQSAFLAGNISLLDMMQEVAYLFDAQNQLIALEQELMQVKAEMARMVNQ